MVTGANGDTSCADFEMGSGVDGTNADADDKSTADRAKDDNRSMVSWYYVVVSSIFLINKEILFNDVAIVHSSSSSRTELFKLLAFYPRRISF